MWYYLLGVLMGKEGRANLQITNILATSNLVGIVISVKILGLKFLPYIAVTTSFELTVLYKFEE